VTTPIISIDTVSRVFVKRLDMAAKIAARLGANVREEVVHAVDDVSFDIAEGEVVGLVGESGCGKSTLGRIVADILPATTGRVLYRGTDRSTLESSAARQAACKVQMIFQDPFASLNPRKRVRDIVGEAPRVHEVVTEKEIDAYVDDVLEKVGLDPAFRRRYPHQFSGGQRQRLGIARALAVKPDFLVCDESVAALDGLTYLFISHDLGVVEHLSDRVVIMYLGRVVESAPTEVLFETPNHPYTEALLREVPRLESRRAEFQPIIGEIPSPIDPPTGCHFHPRCPYSMKRCEQEVPALKQLDGGRLSACHRNETR